MASNLSFTQGNTSQIARLNKLTDKLNTVKYF